MSTCHPPCGHLTTFISNPRPWALTQVAHEILKEPECRGRGGEEQTCTLTDAPCKRERDTGMCEISCATCVKGRRRALFISQPYIIVVNGGSVLDRSGEVVNAQIFSSSASIAISFVLGQFVID